MQASSRKTAALVRTRFPLRDSRRSSRIICESRLLIPSMMQTVRNSSSRIIPTLLYSSHETFSFSSRPMPPAPT